MARSTTVFTMAELSARGRLYGRGKALDIDLRRKIIQDIIEKGGDFTTGFFPGNVSAIAKENRVKCDTVKKIWKHLCEEGDEKVKSQAAGVKHLQPNDIQFIRFLKTSRPSMTTGEVHKHVNEHCNVSGDTSKSAIHRVLRNEMGDGKWTWKKLTRPVAEKFTPNNLDYCQDFVDYISSVDPYKLKFFDESGIKLPDVGRPNYGHSLIGTPAVEIMRYANQVLRTSHLI